MTWPTRPHFRCEHCQLAERSCICSEIEPLELSTQVGLLMHTREYRRGAASGPLLLSVLKQSSLLEYGRRDAALDLTRFARAPGKVLILTDAEGARPLSELDRGSAALLVVPDGTPRQIARGYRRIPGLENAERVCLPLADLSLTTRNGGARQSTFLQAARALAYLESSDTETKLRTMLTKLECKRGYALPAQDDTAHLQQASVEMAETETPLVLLYQDQFLVAINKPSGTPVHKGWSNEPRPALQRLRDQIGQHVFPAHRLDQATSGVLLFALSSEVARELQALFEHGEITKHYLAVCRGNRLPSQTCEHPLQARDGKSHKSAVTEFRPLGTFERYGLIEAMPRTGRTHQIRRHLKHLSHPIIGDVRYGKGEHNRIFRERFGFHRLALHCSSLEFTHPRTGETLKLQAAPTGSLAELFKQLAWTHLLAGSQNS